MVGIVKREKTLFMKTCIAASGRLKHRKALRRRITLMGTRPADDNLLLKSERVCQKVSHGGLSPDTPIDSLLPGRLSCLVPITNEAGNAVDIAKNPRSSEHARSTPHFVNA